ncbi:MAG: porin, partial [Pseudomonadota bacterium]
STGGTAVVGVGFGGDVRPGSSTGDAQDDFHIIRDGEIRFTAQGTLDNGITITARVELDGVDETDQIDENWVEIESAFGSLLIGGNDNAAYNAGFEAGVSYTNNLDSDADGDDETTGAENNDDQVAVGANYQNSFGDFDFAIGGGYIFTEADFDDDGEQESDGNEWGVGVELGFAGFTVTGRYENINFEDDDADEELDVDTFSASLGYGTGPWNFVLGAAYQESELDDGGDDVDAEQLKIHGGAQYALGDGVNVGAIVEYGSVDVDGEDDDEGFGGALLLGVSF